MCIMCQCDKESTLGFIRGAEVNLIRDWDRAIHDRIAIHIEDIKIFEGSFTNIETNEITENIISLLIIQRVLIA